jgi:hypothetical protein
MLASNNGSGSEYDELTDAEFAKRLASQMETNIDAEQEPTLTLEIQRILQASDNPHAILNVNVNATADLNGAYKDLAKKLHPDKTQEPGAAEAFKKLSNAVATLRQVAAARRRSRSPPGSSASPQTASREMQRKFGDRCRLCRGHGHWMRDCPLRTGITSAGGGEVCFRCGEPGHYAVNCSRIHQACAAW